MNRREFMGLIGAASATWPDHGTAQQTRKLPLVGVLNPGSNDVPGAAGFYEGLRDLGYIEGVNIAIERRYGAWNTDRFTELASDLVQLKVDIIRRDEYVTGSRCQTSNQHDPDRSWRHGRSCR